MKSRAPLYTILAVLVLSSGCFSDPEAQKRRFLEAGDRYLDRGDYKTASLVYRKAIQIDRRFGEAYYQLGLAEWRAGRIRPALEALRRANSLMPEHLGAFTRLANLYITIYKSNRNVREETLSELNKLLERGEAYHEGTFEWNRIRGQAELLHGNPEEAVALLNEAEQLEPSANITLQKAQALAGAGKRQEALETVRASIQANPQYGPSYDFLYRILMSEQRLTDAEQVLVSKYQSGERKIRDGLQLANHYWLTKQPDKTKQVLEGLEANLKEEPLGYAAVGDFWLRFRQLDRAEAAFREGLEGVSDNREAFEKRLALTANIRGETDRALELLDNVLKDTPADTEALTLRAAVNARRRDIGAAMADLRKGIEENPRDPALRYRLARAHLQLREWDAAIEQYDEALQLRPRHVPARYELAVSLFASGDNARALAASDLVLQTRPDHTGAHLLQARVYATTGRAEQARAKVMTVLEKRPNHRGAQLQLAALDLVEKRFQSAEDLLRTLLKSDPDDRQALNGLLRTLMVQRRFREAEELLRQRIDTDPDNMLLRNALAGVLVRVGDYDRAIAELEIVRAKFPNRARTALQIGRAHHLAGRLSEAESFYRKALELNSPSANLRYLLGTVVEARGDTADAASHYNSALLSAPDHFQANVRLARLLATQNDDLDRAQSLAERARRKRPDDPEAADALAWVYIKKGLSNNAVPILDDLVRRHPDRPRWRFHLAMALYETGDQERAGRELRTALDGDPSLRDDPQVSRLADSVL